MLNVRQARPDDLDQIMVVEQSWPEHQRATRDRMEARLQKFPQGFLIAEDDGCPVGTLTSCPIHYDAQHVESMRNWETVTCNGLLPDPESFSDANALYIVSAVVVRQARGTGVFPALINKIVEVARGLGLRFVVAGAILPGYREYCSKHGAVPAAEYVFLQRRGRRVDPFMEIYRQLGFRVPDRRHVLPDYYADDPSLNYAAIVVRSL